MDYYNSRDFLVEDPLPITECDISDFFSGKIIFITGSTGFIGTLLLEKLLRCCPGVKQVYILVRMKRGKNEQERVHELLKNDVFYNLWKTYPDFIEKVILISGNCSLPQLGISPEDRERLMDVNVVFHSAACLQFDEHLRYSFYANARATRDLLELAKNMRNLEGFTYVSTAFSQIDTLSLEEKFYEPKYCYEEVNTILDSCTDEEISKLMPVLLGNATTYSFTKSIAEDLMRKYKEHVPIGVIRPSIVVNTYEEPLRGWMNGINGHSAIVIGLLLGILHVMRTTADKTVHIIPADKVAAATIACTWDYAINKPVNRVYNVTSSGPHISWLDSKKYITYIGELKNLASNFSVWEPFLLFVQCPLLFRIAFILLHVIPGCIMDCILKISGNKLSLMRLYRKAMYLWQLMDNYAQTNWNFVDRNLYRVWENMKPNDKTVFNFSMINFDWKDYMCDFLTGLQVYLLKEKIDYDDMIRARRRRSLLKIVHYSITSVLVIFGLWIVFYLTRILL